MRLGVRNHYSKALISGVCVSIALAFVALMHAPAIGLTRPSAGKGARPLATERGTVGSFHWEIGILRLESAGREQECVSAGIARRGEPVGVSRLCRQPGVTPTPFAVGASAGSGNRAAGVIGVMTSQRVRSLTVEIRGHPAKDVTVKLVTKEDALPLGEGAGYAGIAFLGEGCLHRLVAHDAKGRRVGEVVRGC